MLVPNGHNIPTEFLKSLPNVKEKDSLLLVYPGKYAEYYGIDKSIEYMNEIESALKKTRKKYSIEFIGTDILTKKIFHKRNHFKFVPQGDNDKRIPYLDTIKELNKANFAFCPILSEYGFATKISDYLAVGLPIYDIYEQEHSIRKMIGQRLFSDLNHIPEFPKDYQGVYHRKNQMKPLVEYLMKKLNQINDPGIHGMDK